MDECVKKKRVNLHSCLICDTKAQYGLYLFPKDTFIRGRWLSAVKRDTVTQTQKLCFKHFEDSCFMKKNDSEKSSNRLIAGSIPTLHLPNNDKPEQHSLSSDHNYATDVKNIHTKSKNPITIATKKFDSVQKQLENELSEAKKTINSLVLHIKELEKKMASKEYKESICYEMLDGKLSIGQLDIIVRVSTLWGFYFFS